MTKKLKWQVFPGRNRFLCNGRIIIAESLSLFYLSIFLIFTTCSLFFVFDCPFIYKHISPAIPIVALVLLLFTMSCFFHTAFSDPGIIPRARPDEAAYTEQFIIDHYDNGTTQQRTRPPPRTKEIFVNNQPVKIKYCFTCLMFRPPRASHCSVCDNCVDCFDHHCPWVGNCIGRRNYRYFYMFIISFSLLCIYVLACSLTHLILLSKASNFFEACKSSPTSVWVFIVCFVSAWSTLGLAGFHTFLTAVNLTTNEDLKGIYSRDSGVKNPYSSTVLDNCLSTLCASTPISVSPVLLMPAVRYRIKIYVKPTPLNRTNTTSDLLPKMKLEPQMSDKVTSLYSDQDRRYLIEVRFAHSNANQLESIDIRPFEIPVYRFCLCSSLQLRHRLAFVYVYRYFL